MIRTRRRAGVVALSSAVAGAAALAMAGCSGGASGAMDPAKSGTVTVVASTDVWGSVASAVGGDHVKVTSIINDPNLDPHEYQADARNQLAIAQADIVVDNGGGYDDFVTAMVAASKHQPTVLTAAQVSGYDLHPRSGDFNEHLWYDFPTVKKVASRLADDFAKTDPKDATAFHTNATSFDAKLATLEATEAHLKAQHAGTEVTITEPVPLYLLDAIGLKNVTPPKFSEAVENGTDVAPLVLQQTLDLYRSGQVKLLAYNAQTTGAQTQLVVDAAKKNGVAVVPVTETLPQGQNYIQWMTANLAAIGKALGD